MEEPHDTPQPEILAPEILGPEPTQGTLMPADPTPAFEEFAPSGPAGDMPDTSTLNAVHDVPVKVQAVLGRARLPIGDLVKMKAGTVVELDRRVGEPVDIFVNDRLVARGEVMMIDHSLGVTLTEIVRAER